MYKKHDLDKILYSDYNLGYTLVDNDGYFFNFGDLIHNMVVLEYNFNNDCVCCSRSHAISIKNLLLSLGIKCKIEIILLDKDFRFSW